mmetsp:Transcript_22279/g.51389  ORF Transcript_22279/g.51389 Transcript_22279/m.51389 type:complete len:190 (+) Transcript_22279:829-1398(+)
MCPATRSGCGDHLQDAGVGNVCLTLPRTAPPTNCSTHSSIHDYRNGYIQKHISFLREPVCRVVAPLRGEFVLSFASKQLATTRDCTNSDWLVYYAMLSCVPGGVTGTASDNMLIVMNRYPPAVTRNNTFNTMRSSSPGASNWQTNQGVVYLHRELCRRLSKSDRAVQIQWKFLNSVLSSNTKASPRRLL